MSRYVATINIPGYLPQDDEPPLFETAREAWDYLYSEREEALQDGDEEIVDETSQELLAWVDCCDGQHGDDCPEGSPDGTGTVYGPTPGYDGSHDLGLAYSVTYVEDDDSESE
jgi:hypothetical protein